MDFNNSFDVTTSISGQMLAPFITGVGQQQQVNPLAPNPFSQTTSISHVQQQQQQQYQQQSYASFNVSQTVPPQQPSEPVPYIGPPQTLPPQQSPSAHYQFFETAQLVGAQTPVNNSSHFGQQLPQHNVAASIASAFAAPSAAPVYHQGTAGTIQAEIVQQPYYVHGNTASLPSPNPPVSLQSSNLFLPRDQTVVNNNQFRNNFNSFSVLGSAPSHGMIQQNTSSIQVSQGYTAANRLASVAQTANRFTSVGQTTNRLASVAQTASRLTSVGQTTNRLASVAQPENRLTSVTQTARRSIAQKPVGRPTARQLIQARDARPIVIEPASYARANAEAKLFRELMNRLQKPFSNSHYFSSNKNKFVPSKTENVIVIKPLSNKDKESNKNDSSNNALRQIDVADLVKGILEKNKMAELKNRREDVVAAVSKVTDLVNSSKETSCADLLKELRAHQKGKDDEISRISAALTSDTIVVSSQSSPEEPKKELCESNPNESNDCNQELRDSERTPDNSVVPAVLSVSNPSVEASIIPPLRDRNESVTPTMGDVQQNADVIEIQPSSNDMEPDCQITIPSVQPQGENSVLPVVVSIPSPSEEASITPPSQLVTPTMGEVRQNADVIEIQPSSNDMEPGSQITPNVQPQDDTLLPKTQEVGETHEPEGSMQQLVSKIINECIGEPTLSTCTPQPISIQPQIVPSTAQPSRLRLSEPQPSSYNLEPESQITTPSVQQSQDDTPLPQTQQVCETQQPQVAIPLRQLVSEIITKEIIVQPNVSTSTPQPFSFQPRISPSTPQAFSIQPRISPSTPQPISIQPRISPSMPQPIRFQISEPQIFTQIQHNDQFVPHMPKHQFVPHMPPNVTIARFQQQPQTNIRLQVPQLAANQVNPLTVARLVAPPQFNTAASQQQMTVSSPSTTITLTQPPHELILNQLISQQLITQQMTTRIQQTTQLSNQISHPVFVSNLLPRVPIPRMQPIIRALANDIVQKPVNTGDVISNLEENVNNTSSIGDKNEVQEDVNNANSNNPVATKQYKDKETEQLSLGKAQVEWKSSLKGKEKGKARSRSASIVLTLKRPNTPRADMLTLNNKGEAVVVLRRLELGGLQHVTLTKCPKLEHWDKLYR